MNFVHIVTQGHKKSLFSAVYKSFIYTQGLQKQTKTKQRQAFWRALYEAYHIGRKTKIEQTNKLDF